jgi:hypothetical protein
VRRKSTERPLASRRPARAREPEEERRRSSESTSPRSSDPQRLRVTVKLPETIIERARNAVASTADLTLAALVERSLTTYIDQLEKQRGKAFPARNKPLRVGRPRRAK